MKKGIHFCESQGLIIQFKNKKGQSCVAHRSMMDKRTFGRLVRNKRRFGACPLMGVNQQTTKEYMETTETTYTTVSDSENFNNRSFYEDGAEIPPHWEIIETGISWREANIWVNAD